MLDPVFKGRDNYDQLIKIVQVLPEYWSIKQANHPTHAPRVHRQVLGSAKLNAYLEKYDLDLDSQFEGLLGRFEPIIVTPAHNWMDRPYFARTQHHHTTFARVVTRLQSNASFE